MKRENYMHKSDGVTITQTVKVTGHLVFQFGDDSPCYIGEVYNYGDVAMTLSSAKNEDSFEYSRISFNGNNGKSFSLFIKPV